MRTPFRAITAPSLGNPPGDWIDSDRSPGRRTLPAAPTRGGDTNVEPKKRDLMRRFAQVEGYLYRNPDYGQPELHRTSGVGEQER